MSVRYELRNGLEMLDQILNAITHNPWVLALGTVAFFAIKGVLWLLIPFLVIRWRRVANHRHREIENAQLETTQLETTKADPGYSPKTKQAA